MATLDIQTTRPSGDSHADGKAYFETDTNKFIVWNATAGAWIELDSDGTGAVPAYIMDVELSTDILSSGNIPTNPVGEYSVAYGSDTQTLYVWDGNFWNIFNNN